MNRKSTSPAPTDEALMTILGPPVGDDRTEGGLPADRTPDPWESNIQATCECLSWRGALDNLGRRHEEDRLGETVYSSYPVHTHPALVVTRSLIDREIFTSEELESRMAAVRRRLEDT